MLEIVTAVDPVNYLIDQRRPTNHPDRGPSSIEAEGPHLPPVERELGIDVNHADDDHAYADRQNRDICKAHRIRPSPIVHLPIVARRDGGGERRAVIRGPTIAQ